MAGRVCPRPEPLAKRGRRVPAFPRAARVLGSSGAQGALGSPAATSLKAHTPSAQVQGAEEAQKERQRQKELESTYRRVWGSRGGEGTGDLDEFDF